MNILSYLKKKTKKDGCAVREQTQISVNCAPKISPGGTIFGGVLATHIPTYNEVPKTTEPDTT